MPQVMEAKLEDGGFLAFEDAEEEQSEEEPEEEEKEPDWQEEQKNKLSNIIKSRRSVAPGMIAEPTHSSARRSKSHEHDNHDNIRNHRSPLRRSKSRDSSPPRKLRERSPKEPGSPRSSPRATRKVRSTKKPIMRRRSVDYSPTGRTTPHRNNNVDLDEDSLNGSMEFDTQELSPIARNNNHRQNRSNPRLNHSGTRLAALNNSAPRLYNVRSSSPTAGREERRKKMMKRKNSLKAGSLKRLMDAENATVKPAVGGDEVSIDETLDMDDSSGEEEYHHHQNNRNKARRARSFDEEKSPRRGQRRTAEENKNRRGGPRTGSTTKQSKRDFLKKSHSEKRGGGGRRASMNETSSSSSDYKSKSFKHNTHKIAQRMKELGVQHKEVKKKMEGEEEEHTLEELVPKSMRKSKSAGDDSATARTKLGIESLAHLNLSKSNNNSKNNNNSSCFDGSWNIAIANASSDLKEKTTATKEKNYTQLSPNSKVNLIRGMVDTDRLKKEGTMAPME